MCMNVVGTIIAAVVILMWWSTDWTSGPVVAREGHRVEHDRVDPGRA